MVWLPTQSAKNHMQKMNQDLSQSVEVVKDGKIVPELRSVLELIRDHNAVKRSLLCAHTAQPDFNCHNCIPPKMKIIYWFITFSPAVWGEGADVLKAIL